MMQKQRTGGQRDTERGGNAPTAGGGGPGIAADAPDPLHSRGEVRHVKYCMPQAIHGSHDITHTHTHTHLVQASHLRTA